MEHGDDAGAEEFVGGAGVGASDVAAFEGDFAAGGGDGEEPELGELDAAGYDDAEAGEADVFGAGFDGGAEVGAVEESDGDGGAEGVADVFAFFVTGSVEFHSMTGEQAFDDDGGEHWVSFDGDVGEEKGAGRGWGGRGRCI